MKALYEKPSIEVLDFQMNSEVASCGLDVYNFTPDSCNISDEWKNFYGDDVSNPFDDPLKCMTQVKGYCYYTANPAGGTTVFAS